jgi:hypothetical protein
VADTLGEVGELSLTIISGESDWNDIMEKECRSCLLHS